MRLANTGIALAVLWIAYAIFWCGGVGIEVVEGGLPQRLAWTAPFFLVISAALVFLSAPRDRGWLAAVGVAGFLVEVIGVRTGLPFGVYSYTSALGISLLNVPIVMAFAWIILIAWVRQLQLPFWLGAALMVVSDLTLDPVTTLALHLWHWSDPGIYFGIPLSNFAGWYVVSAIMLWFLPLPARNFQILSVGSGFLLLFAAIGLAHGFFVPTSIACLLCGFGYWRWRSSSVSTMI